MRYSVVSPKSTRTFRTTTSRQLSSRCMRGLTRAQSAITFLVLERRATEQLARSTVGREAVANADCGVAGSEIVDVGHMATRKGARRQARIRWLLTLGVSGG